ncbi:hypothetical protein WJX72_000490 [[Myrmecia] bisecta]|uniref:Alpha/beta hydrolase fold-3 domain-containing protein n=1 Tax=[Myrmecia] bisecta TaxID=41462 RepID=A0AAW1QA13_9CHLO
MATLDPQLLAFLKTFRRKPFNEVPWEESQASFQAVFKAQAAGTSLVSTQDLSIPGPDSNSLPIRVYTPEVQTPPMGGLPVLAYFHGGGFAFGDLDTPSHALCSKLSSRAGYIVVSVDYRLAPQHKFPAAHRDAYAAAAWVAEHAASLGGNPSRLAVGGDSAGGNLAIATCLQAYHEDGPRIMFQLLINPVTDLLDSGHASKQLFADGPFLTMAGMQQYYTWLLTEPEQATDALLAPNLATDLEGLPPTFVATAEVDLLRDEAEQFAGRLTEAGVKVEWKRYSGMCHGFMNLASITQLDAAEKAIDDCAAVLRQAAARAHPAAAL